MDRKLQFRRARRLAVGLSPVLMAWVMFALYALDRDAYRSMSFWTLRWPVFASVFIIACVVIWARSRRAATQDEPES